MSYHQKLLGECPNCGNALGRDSLLISYEGDDGWPRTFADCSNCDEVVHPR